MAWFTQEYRSTELNAPPFSGQVGSAIVPPNACLVDGWGTIVSCSSITRSGATATFTVSAADGLKVLKTGMVLTFAGATGGDASLYNITAAITMTSATTGTYTMAGTPSANATGTLTASTYLPITSITRGGTGNLTATVTLAYPNPTILTGYYFTVSGCTGTGNAQYNGTFQVTYVDPTHFTYQMASDPGASASGAPVYAKAPLQWVRPWSAGTNAQTWQSQATLGSAGEAYTNCPVQMIDNGATAGGAKEAQVYCAEVMTADQTVNNGGGAGSGQCPTTAQYANGLCFRKSTTADTTQRAWTIIGDEKKFRFVATTGDIGIGYEFSFGYMESTKPNDLYNTFISAGATFNNATSVSGGSVAAAFGFAPATTTPLFILRDYSGSGSAVPALLCFPGVTASAAMASSAASGAFMGANANGPDNGYYFSPFAVMGSTTALRGRISGFYMPHHLNAFATGDIVPNPTNLASTKLRILSLQSGASLTGQMAYDMFGPWT